MLALCMLAILVPSQALVAFAAEPEDDDVYTFKDAASEYAIRNAIYPYNGSYITYGEIRSISYLYISGEEITTWEDIGECTGLQNLHSYNNLAAPLSEGTFDKLTELISLDLSYNNLTLLPVGIFDKLTKLTNLNLYGNNLTSLPDGIFDELTELTSLDLSYNNLTSLPAGIFNELKALYYINLSGNGLLSLPDSIFKTQADELLSIVPESISYLTLYLGGNFLGGLQSRWFGYDEEDTEWTALTGPQFHIDLSSYRNAPLSLLTDFSVSEGNLTAINAGMFNYENLNEQNRSLIVTLGSLLWKYNKPETLLSTPLKKLVEDVILYGSSTILELTDGTVDIRSYDKLLDVLRTYLLDMGIFDGHEDVLDDLLATLNNVVSATSIDTLLKSSVSDLVDYLLRSYISASGSSMTLNELKAHLLDLARDMFDPDTFPGIVLADATDFYDAVIRLLSELSGMDRTEIEELYDMPLEKVLLKFLGDPSFAVDVLGLPLAVQADSLLEWVIKLANSFLGTELTADMDIVTIIAAILSKVDPSERYPFMFIWKIPTGIDAQTLTAEPQFENLHVTDADIVNPGGVLTPLDFTETGGKWDISLPAQNGRLLLRVAVRFDGEMEKYYSIADITSQLHSDLYYEMYYSGMSDSEAQDYADNNIGTYLEEYLEELRMAYFYFFVDISVPDSDPVVHGSTNIPRTLGVIEKIKEMLEREDHIKYINGYEDGTVRPDSAITRAEVAMIFFRLLKAQDKNEPISGGFTDVEDGSWYAQAVNYLAKIGILLGYPDGTFRPVQNITRAEFAAVASRFDEFIGGITSPFDDVPPTHWAYSHILSAYVKGWINGYPDDTFKPQNNITRAETVAVVNRMIGRNLLKEDMPASLLSRYSDLPTNHWAFADMMEASVAHDYNDKPDGYEIWTDY